MSAFDELLRHPHLWRAREAQASAEVRGLPSGHAALDRCLPGGGWPRQGLIEILTDRYGIGELSLLVPALATLCRQTAATAGSRDESLDGWLAWISPPYQPYAPALAAGGIDVGRVLVVRAEPALWAMEQALRSGACSAVLGWAASCELRALRRLQLAAEQSRCLAVLFRRAGDAGVASPAVLRIGLQSGHQGALEIEILKSRGAPPARVTLPRVH
jgi:hypothetical protein